ncbi:MAG: hypothetical protein U0793_23190 [Gemmataceae bacterium]
MTSLHGPVSCPYCNAVLEGVELAEQSGKVACPRCGEPLPATSTVAATASPVAAAPTPVFPPKPVAANRRVGLLLLGGMSVVAAAALVFALLTVDQRRSRDPRPLPTPTISPAASDLAAFAYLPRDTNFAVGLNVAGLLKDEEAAALLKERRLPGVDTLLHLLQNKTALKLEDIDHLVLGATLGPTLPTVTLVAQTKAPYAKNALEKAMKAPPGSRGKEPLFRFSAPLGEAYLWARAPQTLILLWRPDAVDPKDLDRLPEKAATGPEAIPEKLREFVKSRLEKHNLIWLVGEPERLRPLQEGLAWLKGAPRLPEPWLSLKFAGLSLVNEATKEGKSALTLRGQFLAPDRNTAQTVEETLKKVRLGEKGSNSVAGAPPEAKDHWVLWQARLSAEDMSAWLTSWKK